MTVIAAIPPENALKSLKDVSNNLNAGAHHTPLSGASGNSSSVPILSAVPKPACIFVSRLAPSTTADDVSKYIASKCNVPLNEGYSCVHLNSAADNRFVSSFKIFVDNKLAESLTQMAFWPAGSIVHEFVARKSKHFLGRNSPHAKRKINEKSTIKMSTD